MMRMRTLLFTPGNNLRMLYKAGTLGADAVILDLEDAVPMADKETARLFVRDILPALAQQPSAVFVRINARATGLSKDDIAWTVHPGLDGVILPKSESADDVLGAVAQIEQAEHEQSMEAGSVRILPLLETARGVAAAREVAAAHARVCALAFGGVDFSRDMGVDLSREGRELAYARAHVSLMAHAEDKLALDTPWIDIHDPDGLREHAHTARQLGFHGKLLIHPSQVAPVNAIFSPAPDALVYAGKIVEEFEAARASGIGAISLDGKMIDEANYQQARDLLAFGAALNE